MVRWLTCLGVAVMLAACSGTPAPSAVSSPGVAAASAPGQGPTAAAVQAPTAAPTPAPTPSPSLSPAQLGTMYLACADPTNKVSDAIGVKWNKSLKSLKTLKSLEKQYADNEGVFMACVRAIPWTADFKQDVHDLLKADSAVQVLELQASRAATFSELNGLEAKMGNIDSAGPANQLRGDLGLPPPPVG